MLHRTWQLRNLKVAEIHTAVSRGGRSTYSVKLSITLQEHADFNRSPLSCAF